MGGVVYTRINKNLEKKIKNDCVYSSTYNKTKAANHVLQSFDKTGLSWNSSWDG